MVVSDEVKRKILEMKQNGVSETERLKAYKEMTGNNIKISSLQRQERKWKAKIIRDESYKDEITLTGHEMYRATVQYDSEGNIIQSWAKTKPIQEVWYEQLKSTIEQIKPFEYEYKPIKSRLGHLLEINLVDMHMGINTFEDYEDTLNEIMDILDYQHITNVVITIGQDLFHNNDLRGNTSNGTPIEKVDMDKAFEDAYKFYNTLIKHCIDTNKTIKIIYVRGNHSESVSFLFVKMFSKLYPKLKFDLELKDMKVHTYENIFIGFKHSDKGKNNTKDLRGAFAETFINHYAHSKYREIHLSHLHHKLKMDDSWGFTIRRLGTKAKDDDWSIENNYTGSKKEFELFEYSPKKLKTIYYV